MKGQKSPIHPSYFAFTAPIHFVTPDRYLLGASSEGLLTCSRRSVAIAEYQFLLATYTMRRCVRACAFCPWASTSTISRMA